MALTTRRTLLGMPLTGIAGRPADTSPLAWQPRYLKHSVYLVESTTTGICAAVADAAKSNSVKPEHCDVVARHAKLLAQHIRSTGLDMVVRAVASSMSPTTVIPQFGEVLRVLPSPLSLDPSVTTQSLQASLNDEQAVDAALGNVRRRGVSSSLHDQAEMIQALGDLMRAGEISASTRGTLHFARNSHQQESAFRVVPAVLMRPAAAPASTSMCDSVKHRSKDSICSMIAAVAAHPYIETAVFGVILKYIACSSVDLVALGLTEGVAVPLANAMCFTWFQYAAGVWGAGTLGDNMRAFGTFIGCKGV